MNNKSSIFQRGIRPRRKDFFKNSSSPQQVVATRNRATGYSGKVLDKGFSLIEVLLGLAILAIGLLAIAGMQITAIKGNYFSKSVTEATVLAQDKLEELKNLPYASLSSGQDTKTLSGTTFTRQYNVVDTTSTMKTITVIVQWTDRVDHSISLSTIRAK